MNTTLYIYEKSTGKLRYQDAGDIDYILKDMPEDCDFTLTPYPFEGVGYRWNGLEWVEVETE